MKMTWQYSFARSFSHISKQNQAKTPTSETLRLSLSPGRWWETNNTWQLLITFCNISLEGSKTLQQRAQYSEWNRMALIWGSFWVMQWKKKTQQTLLCYEDKRWLKHSQWTLWTGSSVDSRNMQNLSGRVTSTSVVWLCARVKSKMAISKFSNNLLHINYYLFCMIN